MANAQEEERLLVTIDLKEPSSDDDIMQWAIENINEVPNKNDKIISDFRDFIIEKGECTPHRTDDTFLLRFLRARSFVIPRAHRLLVNYYDFKESNPQYFEDLDMKQLRELTETPIISVLPYKDQLGRRLIVYRIGCWDTSEFTMEEILQLSIGLGEVATLEPSFQIKGGVLLLDFSDMSLSHFWQFTPTSANHIVQILMGTLPIRLEAIHIMFQSWIFDMGFNIIKPFINESMKERIFFHGDDLESLHNHIDPKCLPKIYGGTQLDYSVYLWFRDFIQYNKYVIKELTDLGYKNLECFWEDK